MPGTNYQLDPIRGAFNIGTIVRWLDFNDCFLAAECAFDRFLPHHSPRLIGSLSFQGATRPTTWAQSSPSRTTSRARASTSLLRTSSKA